MLRLVTTPIGNLEDITLRALKALNAAEVVLSEDTRVASKLFSLYEQKNLLNKKEREFISFHSHNEKALLEKLTPEFFNKDVVFISDAGMPCISDPGSSLIRYMQDHALSFDLIPGVSAGVSAYAMSGFEDSRYLFMGFLPHTKKERANILQEVLFSGYTLVFYESPKRVEQLIEEIAECDSERPVFAIKELTKLHQKYFKNSAKELRSILKAQNLKGEWCVVVEAKKGEVRSLTHAQLESLSLPPKAMAKIEAFFSGESVSEIYKKRNQK